MIQTKETLEVAQYIRANPEKVFAVLTGRDPLSKWYCPEQCSIKSAESDVRVGGEYQVRMSCNGKDYTVYGTYLKIIANEKLVFTHQWKDNDSRQTVVTIELQEKNGGTHLRLSQQGFDDPAEAQSHQEGWTSTLRQLEKRLKTSHPTSPS